MLSSFWKPTYLCVRLEKCSFMYFIFNCFTDCQKFPKKFLFNGSNLFLFVNSLISPRKTELDIVIACHHKAVSIGKLTLLTGKVGKY